MSKHVRLGQFLIINFHHIIVMARKENSWQVLCVQLVHFYFCFLFYFGFLCLFFYSVFFRIMELIRFDYALRTDTQCFSFLLFVFIIFRNNNVVFEVETSSPLSSSHINQVLNIVFHLKIKK